MEKYGKMISKTPRSQIDMSVLLHMRPMACDDDLGAAAVYRINLGPDGLFPWGK